MFPLEEGCGEPWFPASTPPALAALFPSREKLQITVAVFYVEADGTGAPMRRSEVKGRKAKEGEGEAKTREVKLGCVFTQTTTDKKGNPLRDPDSTSYVATFESSGAFGTLLRREAFQRGFAAAREVVFIGDGATWVWELARINFPQAVCILDFFHAAEHLGTLAGAIYGADTAKVQQQAKLWRDLLKEDGVDEVISQARAAMPKQPSEREPMEKELAYFEKNRSRMLYATFRSRGFFIGSGIVEAGCKTVVGKRLKSSGMFWSVPGAQNILDLRTSLLSNRFDADWDYRSKLAA